MTYIAADASADGVAKVIYESKNEKILKHLGLWDVKRKPPPCANGPPPEAFIIYDQSSSPSTDDYIIDADYPIETYL